MTSLLSKARNKVAGWIGRGGDNNTQSNNNTTTDTSTRNQDESNNSHQKTSPPRGSTNNNDSSSSPQLASPSKLAQLDKILYSTTSTSNNSSAANPTSSSSSKPPSSSLVDLNALREICWCGIPDASKRFEAWCLMLRYMPNQLSMAQNVLQRKRNEYANFVQNHHNNVMWDELIASQATHGAGHNILMHNNNNNSDNFSSSNNENNSTNQQQQQQQLSPSSSSSTISSSFNNSNNNNKTMDASQEDLSIMRQIRKDVPRTFNGVHMLQHSRCQLLLERVLFIWAIRHPASGYVQGMNDILLPFLFVVLSKKISSDGDVYRLLNLPESSVKAVSGSLNEADWIEVEADSYWLLSAFMSSVQSNFTFSQGGTHSLVQKLDKIIALADPPLHMFLKESGVSFEEFAFRWMNCFLLREMSPALGVRLFDTYCAEEVNSTMNLGFTSINNNNNNNSSNSAISSSSSMNNTNNNSSENISTSNSSSSGGGNFKLSGFAAFHVYVCAALLIRLSEKIRSSDDFALIVRMLQNPTSEANFTEETIGEVTAQAYVLHQQYGSRRIILDDSSSS